MDTDEACKELGSSKVVNMVLLGAASRAGLIDLEELKAAIKNLVKPEFFELNQKAVEWYK